MSYNIQYVLHIEYWVPTCGTLPWHKRLSNFSSNMVFLELEIIIKHYLQCCRQPRFIPFSFHWVLNIDWTSDQDQSYHAWWYCSIRLYCNCIDVSSTHPPNSPPSPSSFISSFHPWGIRRANTIICSKQKISKKGFCSLLSYQCSHAQGQNIKTTSNKEIDVCGGESISSDAVMPPPCSWL